MPKGKRFSAAEKHFMDKERKYQKQIQQCNQTITQISKIQNDLTLENQALLDENTQLKEWVERLLQYTELSLDDVKSVCEKEKKTNQAMASFANLTKVMFGYGIV